MGWVNLDIKQGRSGNYYVELDTFEPKGKGAAPSPKPAKAEPEADDEVPF